jgi:hypothetical protein
MTLTHIFPIIYHVKGFSDININSYRAAIGGFLNKHEHNPPFQLLPNLNPNYRFLVGAQQSQGLSGSCVLNGYGIVGVACASYSGGNAVVVPWSDINKCFQKKKKSHYFPTLKFCNATVTRVPNLQNFVENFLSYHLSHPNVKDLTSWLYHHL